MGPSGCGKSSLLDVLAGTVVFLSGTEFLQVASRVNS